MTKLIDGTKEQEGELIKAPKRGRPSTFKPEYIDKICTMNAEGKTVVQICAQWKISRDTFYRWLKENKELKEAWDNSIDACQDWWEQRYMAAMMGQIPNVKPQMVNAFMKAKFPDWQEKKDDNGTTNINIDTLQVLQNVQGLDDAALDAKIKMLTKKMNSEDE